MLGNFSAIISSNISSGPFSPSSASGTPIMKMLVCLILSQRSLKLFSFLFSPFFFTLFHSSDFHYCLPAYWSFLLPHLFCYWLLQVYLSFQLLYSSTLVVFYIFSLLKKKLLAMCFNSFPEFLIVFTIKSKEFFTVNSFPGRLPICTLLSYCFRVLSCSSETYSFAISFV